MVARDAGLIGKVDVMNKNEYPGLLQAGEQLAHGKGLSFVSRKIIGKFLKPLLFLLLLRLTVYPLISKNKLPQR